MNKSTKLSLVASALLSLSAFAACVPVALEVPRPNGATSTPIAGGTSTPTATPTNNGGIGIGTSTPTATPTNNGGTGIGTSTPVATPANNGGTGTGIPTPRATPTSTPTTTVTPTSTPTATPTFSGGGGSTGGNTGGNSGGVGTPSSNISNITVTPLAPAGLFGDSLLVTGTSFNAAGNPVEFRFYAGASTLAPSSFVSKILTSPAGTTTSFNVLVPTNGINAADVTNDQINALLGRLSGTTVTDADRRLIKVNISIAGSGQSGLIGSGS